jgi:hypothetical protein
MAIASLNGGRRARNGKPVHRHKRVIDLYGLFISTVAFYMANSIVRRTKFAIRYFLPWREPGFRDDSGLLAHVVS